MPPWKRDVYKRQALTLGINSGAYVSEIIRGGLMAVDPGQMEAGRSLGPVSYTHLDVYKRQGLSICSSTVT